MKKIALIILTMITISAYATTICTTKDTVTIVIDPTIDGNQHGSDSLIRTWYVQLPYGRIQGISTCLSKSANRGYSAEHLKDIDGKLVIGNESNGSQCWCKIIHPVVSVWAYGANGNSYGCSACPGLCADYFKTNYSVRASLLSLISN